MEIDVDRLTIHQRSIEDIDRVYIDDEEKILTLFIKEPYGSCKFLLDLAQTKMLHSLNGTCTTQDGDTYLLTSGDIKSYQPFSSFGSQHGSPWEFQMIFESIEKI